MGERLVIVIEYDMRTDPQQALNDAMAQIREGGDRLDPDRVEMQQIHVGIKDYVDRILAVFDKEATPELQGKPMSEPYPSCQRLTDELAALKADYARDAIKDAVKLVQEHEATKRKLKAARATLAKIAAIVADPHTALVVDRIREVLEPTPKGTP